MISEKSAETLYLLEIGGENLLNSLHYLIKISCSDQLKPSFLNKKGVDGVLKKVAKKFPISQDFITKENCNEIIKIKNEILEESQPFYDILFNLYTYKENALTLLRSIFTAGAFDVKVNMNIGIGLLEIFTNLIRAMIMLNRISDIQKIIGAYGIAYQSINNTFENTFIQVSKLVQEYSDPLKKLYEDLAAGEAVFKNILCTLIDEFRPSILEGKQMQTNFYFNISSNSRLMGVPIHSRNPELLVYGYNDFFKWFIYSVLVYTNLMGESMIENVTNMLCCQNVVLSLHRDLYLNFSKELITSFESNKSMAKKGKEIADNAQVALSQFSQFHKDRRDYFKMALHETRLIVQAQPGLLGPKFDKILQLLCLSFEAIYSYFLHFDSDVCKSKKVMGELFDINILQLVNEVILLRDVMLKYSYIIKRYYWTFIGEHDSAGVQHFRTDKASIIKDMQQKDAGLIEGVLNAAKFCQTNSIDRNTELDDVFMALRLDLLRIQFRHIYGMVNLYSDVDAGDCLNNMRYHSRCVYDTIGLINQCAPVSNLWFFQIGLQTILTELLNSKFPKTYASAVYCIYNDDGTFFEKLCPEERPSVGHHVLRCIDESLFNIAKATVSAFVAYWKEHKEIRKNASLEPIVNTWLSRVCDANPDYSAKLKLPMIELPGLESNRILKDELKELAKSFMSLEEFCNTLNAFPQIKVFNHEFFPRQSIIPFLEKAVSAELSDFLFALEQVHEKQIYNIPRRPSVLLSYVKCLQSILYQLGSLVDINFDPMFYACMNALILPSSISSGQSYVQFYANWFIETFLNFNFEDGSILFSNFRQCFITKSTSNIRLDELTDTSEMRAFAMFLGPVGVKSLVDSLNSYITKALLNIKKFITGFNAKNYDTMLKSPNPMDPIFKKDKSSEEFITSVTKIGVVVTFKNILLNSLKYSLESIAPHLSLAMKYGFSHRFFKDENLPRFYNILGYDNVLDLPLYNEISSTVFFADGEMTLWVDNFPIMLSYIVGYIAARGGSEYLFQLEAYGNNLHLVVQFFKSIMPIIFYHYRFNNSKTLNQGMLEVISSTTHVIFRLFNKNLFTSIPAEKAEYYYILVNLFAKNNPFLTASQVEKYIPTCLVVSANDKIMWSKFTFKAKKDA